MKRQSIAHNYVMNALLTLSGAVFPLISFRYASRILLPAGTGKVSFALSLISYFSMLAQLGIPTYGIRACAQVRDNRQRLSCTVRELLTINLIAGLISYMLLALALFTIPRLAEERLLYGIISITILLESIGMEWLYKALEQYSYITIRSVAFKVLALFAMLLLIHRKEDYLWYGAISIFAASASNIVNLFNARKYIDFRCTSENRWKRHLKPVLVFFAMTCATTVYTNLDSLMLGFMAAEADVGYYNAAVKVKVLLVSLVTSLGAVLLPRSSYYIEHRMYEEFRSVSEKALRFVMFTAAPLVVYFIFCARECIIFLSGEAFLPATIPMQLIMPTLFLIGLTNITGIQVMVPLGKEKNVLYSEMAGAITDLILNFLLIPKYQAAGAAIGTLVAETVVLAVQVWTLRDELKQFVLNYPWLRLLLGVLIASISFIPFRNVKMNNFLFFTCTSVSFFGIYVLFNFWRKDDTLMEIKDQAIMMLKRMAGQEKNQP